MSAIDFKRHFHLLFKYSSTLLLVACLAFAGLPQAAAHASGVQSPPNAPLLVPGADASLSIHPLERVMIGEDFKFYATFDNSAETGYGPFIDLVFPSNGIDGAAGTATPDGINFVSAKYESYTLPATVLTFPIPTVATPTPCVSHPFAVDASGNAVQVCGTPGDTLVVLELPFSSITQAMPPLGIDVTAHVSNLADVVDTPLTILGRGGYRFGADNLNNPVSDPAILNPSSNDGVGWPSLQVTPRVIHIEKSFDGPKECPYLQPDEPVLNEADCPYGNVNPVYESVSGPNFPRQYDINIYVAAGQTITNLDVTDYFPNNLAYLGVASLGAGTLVDSPTVGAAANPPDNDLIVNFASLTGSADIIVDFFIPELNADGNPVLEPATGNAAVAENIASALGDWTPVDTRDPGGPDNAIANGPCPGACVPLHTLNIRSIAMQKSVAIETDTGVPGYSPGDLLKYTLDFQISDYFTFGDLKLTDVLSDGQRFDNPGGDFPPVFSVSDRNTTLTDQWFAYTTPPAAPAPGDDLTIDVSQIGNTGPGVPADGTDGSTTLTFDISKAMTNAGASEGILQGGYAGDDPAGSGTPATSVVPATGQITFYATVQESFSDNYPSGDASVDHGDVLFNSVVIEGTIYDEALVTPTLNAQNNDSAQKIEIVYGDITKTVYAVNGSTSFTAPPEVQPGDTITFRMTQTLPSSDSDKLLLTDYLPLPIFDAAEVTAHSFDNLAPTSTIPAAGHANYGPANTLNAALLTTPVIPISADATNSLSFDLGSFDDPSDTTSVLDIIFTVTVTNAPYADGSIITNLTQGDERTTNSDTHYYFSGAQFKLKEPGISLRKGVVASNNAAAVFVPSPPGPVTFNAPGSSPAWSGVIASGDNDPNTALINSDVTNVNSGDLVTFAIVLENLGHSSLGAFDISLRDTKPANMDIPAGGLNLQVFSGDGVTPIDYANIGSGLFDPLGGILFTDESPTQGVAHVYDPANGQNIIVITYDLQIAADLAAKTTIVNTATLLHYAGTTGGPNHVGATPTNNVYSDDATITLPDAAPVIKEGPNVSVSMSENSSPTPFSLKLHATDANGDPLTWSILSPAVYGTTGIGASTGVVSYAPFLNYYGPDSFVVQVSDGTFTDTINVNVTIKSVYHTTDLIWNQSYRIQYDTWIGSTDTNASAFASGYRKATSGTFIFKPDQKFTSFKWITYRGPDQGKANILVDGVVKATIDLYRTTAQWQYLVEIKGLTNAKHTVVIKALNAKSPASSGNWVVVDGFKVGSMTYNDNTINVSYSDLFSYGSWLGKVQQSGPRFGAYRISSVKNASMKFSFTGKQFVWVTARGPLYGKAAIYVDGVLKKTVDLYRSAQQWQYRVNVSLAYGNHNVEIRVLHTKNPISKGFGVISDGFEIN
jgi:hypothetical protein